MPLLSIAIWLPILSGVLLLAFGRDDRAEAVRWGALVASLASFLVTIPLVTGFNTASAAMQFVERQPWISRFNVWYLLGVDGLSVWFVLLTAFITVIVVISAWKVITERVNQYMGAFLILSGLMVGVFSALDGLLFYVFFEATLIPMYLIIGVWGGPRRVYAAFKFFLYTLAGSLLMLVALIYLYYKSGGSFDILAWHRLPLALDAQVLLFFAFFFAFAVKVPMWPVHTWLPDAHVEAPTGGSVVLAAIMLKLGAYGFLRFSLPITPDASHKWAWFMIALSLIAVVYIGFVALVQTDMKKLVAYSSVAHMGFVTLGFFMFDAQGGQRARGLGRHRADDLARLRLRARCSSASACSTTGCTRARSRPTAASSTRCRSSPRWRCCSPWPTAACRAPAGFVGEWMVILGTVKVNFWLAALAATTLICGAAYTLWMVKRVYFGAVANDHVAELKDLDRREFAMLARARRRGAGDGPLSEAVHRRDARLGRAAAAPRPTISKIAPVKRRT